MKDEYERNFWLQLENEQVPAEPVAMVMIEPAAPPPYAASTEDGSQTQPGN